MLLKIYSNKLYCEGRFMFLFLLRFFFLLLILVFMASNGLNKFNESGREKKTKKNKTFIELNLKCVLKLLNCVLLKKINWNENFPSKLTYPSVAYEQQNEGNII